MKNAPGRRFLMLGLLLFCMPETTVFALPVNGVYSHEIQVINQSDGERRRAIREALAAVIVKVTGSSRWLENSAIRQALNSSEGFVEETRYRSETVSIVTPRLELPVNPAQITLPLPSSSQVSYININFSRNLIDRLLTDAAIPVWDSNRPSVMVWMVVQNDIGERNILSQDANPEIVALMQQFARERGIPLLFPLLDFEDRQNLNQDGLWALDTQAIIRASVRYGADSILAGRLHLANSGELVGLWQFLFRDQEQVFDSFDTDLKNYIYAPLDRVTNQLASHFAIVKSTSGQQKVRLRVDGIRNLAAYADLLFYLQGLGLVDSVFTSTLDGESLELELTLLGTQQQLYDLLDLARDLSAVDARPGEVESKLQYRWTR
jgi:uncharacterized protein